MSSALARPLLLVILAAGTLAFGRFAVAGAAGVEDLLAGGLTPSAAPALLGPITSAGRKGWECKPEHVAAAPDWKAAELPADPDSR